ncbi:hypothetical protein [Actinophytocola sp.]|uniref:hypothetical protein n=1 Tax=Actinophytocola sp. TaxID=1872138 RepID=UPI002ED33084
MSRAVLVCLITSMLALVGCSAFSSAFNLGVELGKAGYDVVEFNYENTNGRTVLTLDVTPTDRPATEDEADRVAEIVWTKYPDELDEMRIAIGGEPSLTATEAELTEKFGERPTGLVSADETGADFTGVIVVTLVVAVLIAGLVVFVWWRGRRPPPPVAAPYPPPQYQYYYPPQPPQS